MMKINMVSMGCSKTLVDSEKLMYQLVQNGSQVFFEQEGVFDAVIINTCGFIADAKEESVEMIFQKIAEKHAGKTTFVIVMGCLTQRYAEAIRREIPEIDAVFGVDEPEKVIQWLSAKENIADRHKRVITTPSHYAWLKIAEGCNRKCSFCAIPAIRGRQISLPVEDIIKEALFLRDRGVKEILLVAQDLTAYGTDRYHSNKLAALLRELENIDGLEWIRLHYAYPANFP
ncbi:MAG: radical SAM protein, partial [Bacteroidales bacterium]|nr:radical SAM protein [Bacteroidales bacterium]